MPLDRFLAIVRRNRCVLDCISRSVRILLYRNDRFCSCEFIRRSDHTDGDRRVTESVDVVVDEITPSLLACSEGLLLVVDVGVVVDDREHLVPLRELRMLAENLAKSVPVLFEELYYDSCILEFREHFKKDMFSALRTSASKPLVEGVATVRRCGREDEEGLRNASVVCKGRVDVALHLVESTVVAVESSLDNRTVYSEEDVVSLLYPVRTMCTFARSNLSNRDTK